jgi:hypothetical protein
LSDQSKPWQESPQAAATFYAGRGLKIFPSSAAKRPLIKDWPNRATTDQAIIAAWWRMWPYAEPAWALPYTIAVLDLDVKNHKNGYADFERLAGIPADRFPAPQASSPSGGRHLICATGAKRYLNAVPIAGLGVDLKTQVGFVVLPGAGNGRRWIPGKPSKPAPIPPAISALLKGRSDLERAPAIREHISAIAARDAPGHPLAAFAGNATRYGRAALEGVCSAIRNAPDGIQEITLNSGAHKIGLLIGRRELPPNAADAVLEAGLAMPSYDPRRPWTVKLIENKITRGIADGMRREARI